MDLAPEEDRFIDYFQEDIDKVETVEQFYDFFWKEFENNEVPDADWSRDYFGEMYSPITRRVMIGVWYQRYGVDGFNLLLSIPSQGTIEEDEAVMKNNVICRLYLKGEHETQKALQKKYGQFFEDILFDSEINIKLKNFCFDSFTGLSKKATKKKFFEEFLSLPEEKIRRGIVHTYTHRFSNGLTHGLVNEIVEIALKSPYTIEVY